MSQDMEEVLEIFGQMPSLALYINNCVCFPMRNDVSSSEIVARLTKGFERLAASFPWVTGQVINEGASEGNSGVFKIKKSHDVVPPLITKDLRGDLGVPSMEAMRQADFPIRMLDERVFAARQFIPSTASAFVAKPVFLLQVNFARGGLFLTFTGHHQAMDATGLGLIMDLLDKACRTQAFTKEELSGGNIFRRDVVPMLKEPPNESTNQNDEAHKASAPYLQQETTDASATTTQPPRTWINLSIDPASVAALKDLAKQVLKDGKSFISADDAITAFMWQSITRAKLSRLDPSTMTTLSRAVDMRRFLGVPETCTGPIQNITYFSHTVRQLLDQPLGAIALQLRAALVPETSTVAQETRDFAAFLHRTPDKSVAMYAVNVSSSTGLKLTSWSKLNSYSLDFGLGLGKPEVVRTPKTEPYEGVVCLLPKTREGGIEVAMCLRDGDLERLKADEMFMKYAKWIG